MRTSIITLCLGIISALGFAQNTTQAKDSIKTEVINVVTSYMPTISDAFKIKKNPRIQLGANTKRKQVNYKIFSAPVASTFIPKSGVVKGIDLGVKERLYNNYAALGFGNYNTPFLELFVHKTARFKNEFGMYAKYISSENSIEETPLNSNYSDLNIGGFYKEETRYFNWKVGAEFSQETYNWYGLPSTVNFTAATINSIDEAQTYTDLSMQGDMIFEDSFITNMNAKLSFFSDKYTSKELRFTASPQFQIPLNRIARNLNDLALNTTIDYVNGEFAQSYEQETRLEHSFFVLGALPKYNFELSDFTFNIGAKMYFTSDLEYKISQLYLYPDVKIKYPIMPKHINAYIGATGDLTTNTYKAFAEENPYLSPTQYITQTNTKYDLFLGFNGKLSSTMTYNIKASFREEDDKAFFTRNNTKSDGSNTSGLLGYDYGNSFSYIYDDTTTQTLEADLAMIVNKHLSIGAHAVFNSYNTTKQLEAWNAPQLTSDFFANYKRNSWYANANLFFVSERKDTAYDATFPNSASSIVTLPSFMDVNLNGGYHFNDKFTAFLKMNNILNTDYQRFSNFNTQGFQVLAGLSYKFDF